MKHGGTLIAFEINGAVDTNQEHAKAQAFSFMNHLQLVDISNNFGDAKSLVTNPATTTHSSIPQVERLKVGITDGLIRLSVGLEDSEDLLADLERALENV